MDPVAKLALVLVAFLVLLAPDLGAASPCDVEPVPFEVVVQGNTGSAKSGVFVLRDQESFDSFARRGIVPMRLLKLLQLDFAKETIVVTTPGPAKAPERWIAVDGVGKTKDGYTICLAEVTPPERKVTHGTQLRSQPYVIVAIPHNRQKVELHWATAGPARKRQESRYDRSIVAIREQRLAGVVDALSVLGKGEWKKTEMKRLSEVHRRVYFTIRPGPNPAWRCYEPTLRSGPAPNNPFYIEAWLFTYKGNLLINTDMRQRAPKFQSCLNDLFNRLLKKIPMGPHQLRVGIFLQFELAGTGSK